MAWVGITHASDLFQSKVVLKLQVSLEMNPFDQFPQLLTAVANMKDGDPLIPDEPLND